ncbi:MAG: threonine/serine dehydratase [Atribacterota bacterium]
MVNLKDIGYANKRITKYIKHTPLYYSSYLSNITHNKVFLKLENLQNTNSFKVRGAFNYILQIESSVGMKGVITASSGNHGNAVAFAASCAGYPARVVVPVDAPEIKIKAIKEFGAEVIPWGKYTSERNLKAKEIAKKEGLTFVDSVDHPWIIAGQGTVGLEIIKDFPEIENIIVPIGGGGLISGISIAVKEQKPDVRIYGTEPEESNSMYLSLSNGEITELNNINTIADGLRSNKPGYLTFDIVKKYVNKVLLVKDDDIKFALKTLLLKEKFLAEPSGAVALAALLSGKFQHQNSNVALVISGGNVDLEMVKKFL